MLKVSNYSLEINNNKLLNDVNFEINKNEIVSLLGRNGAGKSSLAMSILGMRKFKGEILFKDYKINEMNKKDLRNIYGNEISYVFQNPKLALNPIMKIGKQIKETIMLNKELTNEEVNERVLHLLSLSNLDKDVLDKFPNEVSGGQAQLIVIIISICNNPDFIICDEITSNLDIKNEKMIIDRILDINKEFKTAILFITHDMELARRISNKFILLKDNTVNVIDDVNQFVEI